MHIIMMGWLKGKPHPCDGAGGIEKMVATLCAELVRQGHQITLIAPAGSYVEGCEVIETSDTVEATNIANCLKADVVHDHSCWSLDSPVRQGLRHPFISTTHVNHAIGWSKNVVYLSHSQREKHGTQLGRDTSQSPVIYVPINPNLAPSGLPRNEYLLYLGRIEPEKGVLEAANVAHMLRRTLIVAGPIDNTDYATKIEALCTDVMWLGEVKDPYRSELIEQAWALMCLFNDTNGWAEPGCGVFGEAMALNTPVAAFRNGCMPELVKDGLNGWIADRVDDIATFMEYGEYPKGMKASALHYSAEKIVREYVGLYERVIQGFTWG